MPEEEKKQEGVQDEGGKPADKDQASPSEEQADSGVIELDVAKKYHSKRRPDVLVSGDDLMSGYARGQEFDKLQSKFQKQEVQSEADTGKLAEQAQRIAQLESDTRLAKSMQNLGVAAVQKPVAAAEDWLTPGEGVNDQTAPANGTPIDIASRMSNFETEMESRLLTPERQEEILRDQADRRYAIEQEKRDTQESIRNADEKMRSAKLVELEINMPDISKAALAELVDADADYLRHALDGRDLLAQGKGQAGIETFMDGLQKARLIKDKELDLMAQQRKITAKRELDAELESLSGGSPPGEEPAETRESIRDSKEATKKAEANLAEAHKMVDRQKVLKNSAMT